MRSASFQLLLALVALLALLVLPSCGLGPRVLLVVDVQTDMTPIAEFREIRVRVGDEAPTRAVEPGESFLEGRRAAELRVSPGTTRVSVELLDASGAVAAERAMIVELRTDTAIIVPISSLCRGVTCSNEDETCIQGRCASITSICGGNPCDPRTECPGGLCDPVVCDVDEDCDRVDPCSTPGCAGGICVGTVAPGACAATYYCSVGLGCREIPPGVDLDGGVARDGGPTLDGGPRRDAGPTLDGGPRCGSCRALCGSTGGFECDSMGLPTENCLPPLESCTGRDDDCDGRIDEGLLCDHQHTVVIDLRVADAGIVDNFVGAGPSRVCAGAYCGSTLTDFTTTPGPDGHTHDVYFNGASTLVFGPTGTSFAPTGTSTDNGHSHEVQCEIFDGADAVPGTTFRHNLDMPGELGRYNMMCVPPLLTGECRRSFGNCVAH